VQRRWDDGSLLRAWLSGEQCPVIEVRLRGPGAGDLGEHFDAARRWVDAVTRGSHHGIAYDLVRGRIGGRLAGATDVPVRAVIRDYDQAWQLLGVRKQAETWRDVVALANEVPAARDWALTHPHRAIRIAGEWPTLLSAYRWLDTNRDSGLHLRQIDAEGVDTKFVERHRSFLAAMLGVSGGVDAFVRELGLAVKPSTVRLRFASGVFDMPAELSEASFRLDELDRLHARVETALIVENEITYLSVPVPRNGVVLWGRGYDADRPASLSWLSDASVLYWGDLDTHGFSILNRVRTWLPQTESVLMDRETLLEHRGRWVTEPAPTVVALPRLTAAEAGLYDDLVTDRWGAAVRMEQERIDWDWAMDRLRR
jgi:hypothetical protein